MSTLHTIATLPNSPEQLAQMLQYRGENDPVLLMQDAVLAASQPRFAALLNRMPVYLLADDLSARGTAPLPELSAQPIDYNQFVQLCLDTNQQIAW
ncbi:sulfurtransferase complex subunit TusB [Ferrimonas senticii]|uniref:sulfurtransferase complex subunit TusB n=1 Tax=Ferrimonas senticii TaxID=394566 RepID=UPI0003F64631|nr:sulfurtransferase complex subunit TusB [Ferrimonas senticii]